MGEKNILIPLLSLYKNNQEIFYNDIIIDAVFGNFSHSIWDGGRPDNSKTLAYKEDIILIQNIYNNILNVSMRFVCSNPFIQAQDCKDKFCNLVLSLCENEQNHIIIKSELLENYIRSSYHKYKFISSTTKILSTDEEIIKELEKDYLYVCLPYYKNYDFNFLEKIPLELKNKVELLINEKCYFNCPKRQQHYIEISKSNYTYDYSYTNNFSCFTNTKEKKNQNNIITYENLNKYNDLNINHFKLEGRDCIDDYLTLYDIITYCIKPEQRFHTLKFLHPWIEKFDLENYNLNEFKL